MKAIKPRALSIEDLCRLKLVSDLQLSPNGYKAAFVLSVANYQENGYQSAVWLAELESGKLMKLTNGIKCDSSPRWAPDGRRIAFISNRYERNQVWIIDAAGGEATQLTRMQEGISELIWSPDGSNLVFTCMSQTRESKDSGGHVRVVRRLRYRLNGKGILDDRRKHLWIVPIEGGEPRQLTDGDWEDGAPAWRPNGDEIAFLSNRTDDRDYNNVNDIWLVAVGGEPRKLTSSEGPIQAFSWSSEGDFIAFVGNDRANQVGAHNHLWILDAATGRMRNLTGEFDHSVGDVATSTSWKGPTQKPVWTEDGKHLYFLASDRGDTHILRVDLSGNVQEVVGGPRVCLSFGLSQVGERISFIATTPIQPTELFVCLIDGSNERRLTGFNDSLLNGESLVSAEQFCYRNDDTSIDGWLLKPPWFEAGQRYPMILSIHGGPLAFYGNGFLFDEQLLAAAGYIVLLVNPRGSTGYGQEFVNCLRGDLGGKDYDDLMCAVDYAINLGFVDSRRLGVIGGSYGGYMTNRIITRTNRFRAAVTEKCISNFVSLYGTTDTTFLDCDWYFGGMPQDNLTLYMDRSPISHINQVTTPLLIIHGEEDLNCPIEQAEQLFVGLKRLGREVEFVRFPGENHELNRSGKPQARIERLKRIVDWFAKYLSSST